MPPMSVYFVGKGKPFDAFAIYDGTNEQLYQDMLEKLRTTTLDQLAADYATQVGLSADDVTHFQSDWLGASSWWPGQHVELVLRAGIRRAIQTALPNESHTNLLPIEALWVSSPADVFHVYVNEGPHQVTILVYTPPMPEDAVWGERHERIWVVKTRDDADGDLEGSAINAPQRRRRVARPDRASTRLGAGGRRLAPTCVTAAALRARKVSLWLGRQVERTAPELLGEEPAVRQQPVGVRTVDGVGDFVHLLREHVELIAQQPVGCLALGDDLVVGIDAWKIHVRLQ